jgi:hypothetical protein
MRTLFGCWLATAILVTLLLGMSAGAVMAQSKSSTAPVVTQQMVDDLVNAIITLAEKLKKDGSLTAKPAEPAPAAEETNQDWAQEQVSAFVARAQVAVGGYPELWRNLTRIPALLDKSDSGGRGLGLFLAMLGAVIAAASSAAPGLGWCQAAARGSHNGDGESLAVRRACRS